MSDNTTDQEDKPETNSKISIIDYDPETDPVKQAYEIELKNRFSKNDINKIFDVLTENKVLGWENKLLESKNPIRDFSKIDDSEILNEKYCDPKIRRLIKGDIERTRVQECIYFPSFKDYCIQFISYYLAENKILYKQGLNEITGPFILLKYKLSISFTTLYKMFVCFIDKYLTNYYLETEFFSLRSSLALINLLLKYHDPKLYSLFEDSLITPDLYATSWILTLFSNKCPLDVIYHLWDKLILFDDNLILHFFIVSFLIINREIFMDSECAMIPSKLSQLHIMDIEKVDEILTQAMDLRDKTPNSFYLFSDYLEIFVYNSKYLKSCYEKYGPNKIMCMPIFPSDLFYITYKNLIGCSNENCKNFLIDDKKNNKNGNDKNFTTEKIKIKRCKLCRDKNKLQYIVLDLRNLDNFTLKDKDNNNINKSNSFTPSFPGFLPKTIKISKEDLESPDYPKNILKNFSEEKNNYHFILMTSDTENYNKYENEYYKETKKRRSGSGIFFKIYKELDKDKFNELSKKKKNNNLSRSLKEFDNFKVLVERMTKEGFKYISFVYGGFENVHDFALKYNISLLDHGKECILCKEKNKNKGIFKFW